MPTDQGQQIFIGVLDPYEETGSEGTHWSIFEDETEAKPNPFERTCLLRDSDVLTVYTDAARTTVLWEGTIKLERESHRTPGEGQSILGYWVQGLQEGADAKSWAQMFFDKRPARLVRKPA